jgi:peptidoglycan/xylan/chitin deacetylase (PgdA/CDA1 family)
MSKRAFVRNVLRKTGILELCWRRLGPHLYCFNYHRIGDPNQCAFDRGVFSCSAERFREHIRLLRERFEIVDIARLSFALQRARPRQPMALITFDDGYIDNYELAFPILKEFGVTAAFFIPTGFIGGSQLPWWDEIAWSLRNASTGRISLGGHKEEFDLAPGVIDQTIAAVLELVKRRRDIPMHEQVAEVSEACRPRGSVAAAGAGLFVHDVQIGEMRQAGMDIGSHTHTHRILSHLDPDEQEDELGTSKEILEGLLGEPVNAVAYPVGAPGSYGPETCRIAESLGYDVGFNFIPGVNHLPTERPLDLNRLAVEDNAAPMQLKLSAAFPWL